jgi:hypothetical protein
VKRKLDGGGDEPAAAAAGGEAKLAKTEAAERPSSAG